MYHLTLSRNFPKLLQQQNGIFQSKLARNVSSVTINKDLPKEKQYDVLIVGGGIVGSSLACKLKANPYVKGKRIGLIESEDITSSEFSLEQPDLRVYTITPASVQLFQEIGVWEKIQSSLRPSFQKMQVWDAMGDGYIRFNSKNVGKEELAYVIENKVLQMAINERLQELTQQHESDSQPLELICPAKVKAFNAPTDSYHFSDLLLDNGEKKFARLVIAADGGNSVVRTLSGLGTWGWEYDQKAVVATIKTDVPNTTAWQRFFPTGPLALLPMRDGYTSIVWSCSDEMAKKLVQASSEEFLKYLTDAIYSPGQSPVPPNFPGLPVLQDVVKGVNQAVHTILAASSLSDSFETPPKPIEVVGKRVAFPLKMKHATRYSKHGVALIGDSAHTIHPLAGQGLNLGLADVQSLGNHLIEGIKNGENLASEFFLEDYDADRKSANITMALAMDGFKRLFGPTPDAIGVARNVGMGTLNMVEPIKNKIMKYAMGI